MVDEQSFVFYEPPMLVEASEAKFDAKVGAVEEEMEDFPGLKLEIAPAVPLKSHRYDRDAEVTQEDCELINFDITLNQTTQLQPIVDTTMRPEQVTDHHIKEVSEDSNDFNSAYIIDDIQRSKELMGELDTISRLYGNLVDPTIIETT